MLTGSSPQVALLETSPYLLALTIIVSIVHSIFEFLAFKNGRYGAPGHRGNRQRKVSAPCFLPLPGVSLHSRGIMGWAVTVTPTRHRAEGGAWPAVWAKARVTPPGSRVGISKVQRKGSPRAAPSTPPVRPHHAATQF